LKESGWKWEVNFWQVAREGHSFHMVKPKSEKAIAQAQIIADFINEM
jgi:hypothetical protein